MSSRLKQDKSGTPIEYLLSYYDIVPMELFEITNMADSPYYINDVGSLVNREGEIRNEMFSTLLIEPHLFKRCRKMKDLASFGALFVCKNQEVITMNKDVNGFLILLCNMFKNASTTNMTGIGECYIITKELRDEIIAKIEDFCR